MLFHAPEFWIFLPLVLLAFYSMPLRTGKLLLLAASYFFYMWWKWYLAGLILTSTVVDYWVGLAMRNASARRRKLLLVVSLCCNLGLLGFFKYYDFFAESLALLLGVPEESWALSILLPVGISFYTFQSLSYTIDLYRRQIETITSFTDFALFVSFFPQLVAGPIVRAATFFPQLYAWKRPSPEMASTGLHLILWGLIEKMVFADNFAQLSQENFERFFDAPAAVAAWAGTFAFSMQVYFDFAGYSNIARGCGKLLGFEFPINFRRPFLATSIAEFWRRWHISLSTWFRDYLFVGLGGSRGAPWRVYRNLMITMVLVGLWHGAGWNFVLWGGYLGVLIIAQQMFRAALGRSDDDAPPRWWTRALGWFLTFLAIQIAMVFFRFDFERAMEVLSGMFAGELGSGHLGIGGTAMVIIAAVISLVEERKAFLHHLATGPAWLRIAWIVVALFLLELFSVTDREIPFVYFQF